MADVVIFHSADKETAATRLTEAILAAGFTVGAAEVEDPTGLADAVMGCDSEARILIWSRPLVSHALHSGDLSRIRQLAGLIEVSADGIAPPSRGDDSRTVSLSGWRGQPFHPGWQRIHAELKRLCGPGKAVAETRPARPAKSPDPRPQAAEPAASVHGARPKSRLMLGGGIAILLVAGSVGAASWLATSGPEVPPRGALGEARPPSPARDAPQPAPVTVPESAEPVVAAPPAADPSPPSAEPAAAAKAAPEPPDAGTAQRPVRPKPAARAESRPRPQAAAPKKYSRKNSKVMRQFCERSGRSTPQCRTFLRSNRGGEAE
jgi:hypothetical protein